MIQATSITLSYDDIEDRIVLDGTDGKTRRTLLLTRRITGRLLSAFAHALTTSSTTLPKTPVEMRHEVIVLEHVSALMAPAAPIGEGSGGERAAPVDLGRALVVKVDVQIQPATFGLLFQSAKESLVAVGLTRGDLHKLLGALNRQAKRAQWQISDQVGWLDNAEAVALSTGGRDAS